MPGLWLCLDCGREQKSGVHPGRPGMWTEGRPVLEEAEGGLPDVEGEGTEGIKDSKGWFGSQQLVGVALPENRSRSRRWDWLGRGWDEGRVNGEFCFAEPLTQLRGYLETKGCQFILKDFFLKLSFWKETPGRWTVPTGCLEKAWSMNM